MGDTINHQWICDAILDGRFQPSIDHPSAHYPPSSIVVGPSVLILSRAHEFLKFPLKPIKIHLNLIGFCLQAQKVQENIAKTRDERKEKAAKKEKEDHVRHSASDRFQRWIGRNRGAMRDRNLETRRRRWCRQIRDKFRREEAIQS